MICNTIFPIRVIFICTPDTDLSMETKTTRQKIIQILHDRSSMKPTAIVDALGDQDIEVSPDEVVNEIDEISKSIDRVIEVAPPVCRKCKFSNFDNLANIPSQCPECKSTYIEEPEFRIREF